MATTASFGLRCLAYVSQSSDTDGQFTEPDDPNVVPAPAPDLASTLAQRVETSAQPIPGLRLYVSGHDERPVYHRANGIYGFVDLPATQDGEYHTVHIDDPQRRYLPRRWRIEVPDQSAYERALMEGDLDQWDRGATGPQSLEADDLVDEVPMFPAIGLSINPAELVVWGRVTDRNYDPVPYAPIVVRPVYEELMVPPVVSATDDDGVFVTWLARGLHRRLDWLDFNDDRPKLVCHLEVYEPASPEQHGLSNDFEQDDSPQHLAVETVELEPGERTRQMVHLSNWEL